MPWHEKLLLSIGAIAVVVGGAWWLLHLLASGDQ